MATFLDQTQLTIQGNWFGFANVNSKALNIDIFYTPVKRSRRFFHNKN